MAFVRFEVQVVLNLDLSLGLTGRIDLELVIPAGQAERQRAENGTGLIKY